MFEGVRDKAGEPYLGGGAALDGSKALARVIDLCGRQTVGVACAALSEAEDASVRRAF
jgi:hypothetical protein